MSTEQNQNTKVAEIENPDPFVANIMESMTKVVDPVAEPTPIVPVAIADVVNMRVNGIKQPAPEKKAEEEGGGEAGKEKPAAAPEKKEGAEAAATATEKKTEAAAATPAAQPKLEQRAVVQVVRREPAKPTQDPEAQKLEEEKKRQQAEDQSFIDSLTPEQKEELEFAQFAEAKGKKGVVGATTEYFKKLDAILQEHPDWTSDSEEFAQWVRENEVKWTPGERRKMERDMILDTATQQATKKAQEDADKKLRDLRESIEVPHVQSRVNAIESAFSKVDEKDKDMPVIEAEVFKSIRDDGFDKAAEKFPHEAPIVQGTINAINAWERIARGLDAFDPKDPVHQYIAQFLGTETTLMANAPENVRVVNGKSFMPIHELQALAATNPAEAAKHWTFTREMISDRIEQSARRIYQDRINALKASGWQRVKVSPKQETAAASNGAAAAARATNVGGPEATTASIPGADVSDPGRSAHAQFLDKLLPGASAIVGQG